MNECIQIYIRDIPDPGSIDSKILEEFPSARRDFIKRAAPKPAAESYAAGLLLREILDVRKDEDLKIAENGKPYLANDSCFFSLSHSAAIAVLAVAPVEIGVDTEPVRDLTDSLIRKVFNEEEKGYIKEDPVRNSVILWTRLEAGLKLTGEGISGIDSRKVSLLTPDRNVFYNTMEIRGSFISTACRTDLPIELKE